MAHLEERPDTWRASSTRQAHVTTKTPREAHEPRVDLLPRLQLVARASRVASTPASRELSSWGTRGSPRRSRPFYLSTPVTPRASAVGRDTCASRNVVKNSFEIDYVTDLSAAHPLSHVAHVVSATFFVISRVLKHRGPDRENILVL